LHAIALPWHKSAKKEQRTEGLQGTKLDAQAQRRFRTANHKMPPSITPIYIWCGLCKETGPVLQKTVTGCTCVTAENFESAHQSFISQSA